MHRHTQAGGTVQSFVNISVYTKDLWMVSASHSHFYSVKVCALWQVHFLARPAVQQPPSLPAELLPLNFAQDKYFTQQALTSSCSVIPPHLNNRGLKRCTVTAPCRLAAYPCSPPGIIPILHPSQIRSDLRSFQDKLPFRLPRKMMISRYCSNSSDIFMQIIYFTSEGILQ